MTKYDWALFNKRLAAKYFPQAHQGTISKGKFRAAEHSVLLYVFLGKLLGFTYDDR